MIVWVSQHVYLLLGVGLVLFEVAGIALAVDAIMKNRTAGLARSIQRTALSTRPPYPAPAPAHSRIISRKYLDTRGTASMLRPD